MSHTKRIEKNESLSVDFGFKTTWLWKFTQESNSFLVITAASYGGKCNEENMIVRCSWNASFVASCPTRRIREENESYKMALSSCI